MLMHGFSWRMLPTDALLAVLNVDGVCRDHFHECQRRISYDCSRVEALSFPSDEADCHIRQEMKGCRFRDAAVPAVGGQIEGTSIWSLWWIAGIAFAGRLRGRIDAELFIPMDRVRLSVCAFQ